MSDLRGPLYKTTRQKDQCVYGQNNNLAKWLVIVGLLTGEIIGQLFGCGQNAPSCEKMIKFEYCDFSTKIMAIVDIGSAGKH